MEILGVLVLLASVLAFWGGVGWLIVSLFRKKSVRRSLGLILVGVVLLPIGIVVMIVGGDEATTDEPVVSKEAASQERAGSTLTPAVLGKSPTNPVVSKEAASQGRTGSTPTSADTGKSPTNPVAYGVPIVHTDIEVTVLDVKRNHPTPSTFFEPKDDHEWVTVTLRVRNVDDNRDKAKSYNDLDFRMTGKRGLIYNNIFTPDTDTPLGSGDFFGGGEVTGDVVREVHKDDSELVLIFTKTFQGSRYLSLEK